MTKKELLEAIASVPDDTVVSAAVITWGEVDLDCPEDIEMYRYVDEERYKNIPQE